MDIITISCEDHTKYVTALCKQNAVLSSVKGCDAYSNHRRFNGLIGKHLRIQITDTTKF
jgi:hypothetical protein